MQQAMIMECERYKAARYKDWEDWEVALAAGRRPASLCGQRWSTASQWGVGDYANYGLLDATAGAPDSPAVRVVATAGRISRNRHALWLEVYG